MSTPTQTPRTRLVLLSGPSGSGKSSLAERSGLPVLALDDFYKDGDDPSLPLLPGGATDWDSPDSWNRAAALAALRLLLAEGAAEIPVYSIPTSSRTGSRVLRIGTERVLVAEGVFAADIIRDCREAGIPTEALCLHGNPFTTFRRRLARDLREGRKSAFFLLRRGLLLLRAERGIVARHTALGARPCRPEEARRLLAELNTAAPLPRRHDEAVAPVPAPAPSRTSV